MDDPHPEKQQPLLEAADRFADLCREKILVGYALIQSRDRLEYRFLLDADWSCLEEYRTPDGKQAVRFRMKRSDFATDAEFQDALGVNASVLISLHQMLSTHAENLKPFLQRLSTEIGAIQHHRQNINPRRGNEDSQ